MKETCNTIGAHDGSDAAPNPWRCRLRKTVVIGPRIAGETTPFVFQNRLFRVENHPRYFDFPGQPPQYRAHEDEIRIRDVEADRIVSVPLRNHYFGHGFVHDGRLHLFAGVYEAGQAWWHIRRIVMVSTADLVHWDTPRVVLEAGPDEHIFNIAVCRGRDAFVLLYETDDRRWPKFTFRYCESDDLVHWRPVPGAIYGKDKYVGGPALYYEGGMYYTLYLHALGGTWETRVTRSANLVDWEDAPPDRPFLSFASTHRPDPEYHPAVYELNASDAELCYWRGKTIVTCCGGNQQGISDLQTAEFDGTPAELLAHYFA